MVTSYGRTEKRRYSILSFCSHKKETLFIDQWRSFLVIYWLEDNNQYKKIGIRNALISNKTRFLTITSGEKGSSIYIDGKIAGRFPEAHMILPNDTITGNILRIGNSRDATRSWTGDLFGLAVYDCSLTETQVLQHFQQWTKSGNLSPPIQRTAEDSGVRSSFFTQSRGK